MSRTLRIARSRSLLVGVAGAGALLLAAPTLSPGTFAGVAQADEDRPGRQDVDGDQRERDGAGGPEHAARRTGTERRPGPAPSSAAARATDHPGGHAERRGPDGRGVPAPARDPEAREGSEPPSVTTTQDPRPAPAPAPASAGGGDAGTDAPAADHHLQQPAASPGAGEAPAAAAPTAAAAAPAAPLARTAPATVLAAGPRGAAPAPTATDPTTVVPLRAAASAGTSPWLAPSTPSQRAAAASPARAAAPPTIAPTTTDQHGSGLTLDPLVGLVLAGLVVSRGVHRTVTASGDDVPSGRHP